MPFASGGAALGLAAGGALLGSGLFGGGDDPKVPQLPTQFGATNPLLIQTPGFASSLGGGSIGLQSTNARAVLVNRLAQAFENQSGELTSLRSRIRPGFGELTQATRDVFSAERERLRNARRRTIGNLRDTLARRRVLGSRFATDDLVRAGLSFDQESRALAAQEREALARSFLQEFELTTQNIEANTAARVNKFQTFLDSFNIEAQLAAGLAGAGTNLAANATSVFAQNARLQAELAAQAAAGKGEFFGQIAEPFITGGVQALSGSLFG